jgi:hypothetical protein
MVAPHPDSLAFHHKPVNGDATEVSMVNVWASARIVPDSSQINAAMNARLNSPLLSEIFGERFARIFFGFRRFVQCE